MFGLIMPAPLLMPVSVTVCPSICTCRDAAFGSVSVVMMVCAASYQCAAFWFASAAGKPALRRSTGSGSRITPVENGRICSGVEVEEPREFRAGFARMRHARLAGARIRVARIHDERANALAARAHGVEMLAAHRHRRRAKAIQREHARDGRALFELDDEQILAIRLANVGFGPA